jgi:hypothetical protein
MNPSEYLFNEDFMILNDDYKLKVINKLDKLFIDREELKEEIRYILATDSSYIPLNDQSKKLIKEILELLK